MLKMDKQFHKGTPQDSIRSCFHHIVIYAVQRSDKNSTINKVHVVYGFMSVSTRRSACWQALVLHEHAAFGPVLPNGGWVLMNLSPGRLLGDPLEAAT